jgi:hypothetical protein
VAFFAIRLGVVLHEGLTSEIYFTVSATEMFWMVFLVIKGDSLSSENRAITFRT